MNEEVKYTLTLNDLLSEALKRAGQVADQFEGTLAKIGETAQEVSGLVVAAFSIEKIYEFGNELMHVTAEFEGYNNMVKYSSVNSADAAKNIDYISDAVNRLHLPIRQTNEGFAEMQAGFYGTGIEGDNLRKVFEGISEASTVLHQTPEQFSHVTFALKEIGELGTVQARQMRMLAFALPGSMQMAADAMHMNSQKFHEAMHKGQISSNQFLLAFADELKQRFGPGLENASQSLIAKMNDTNNRYVQLQLEMGEKLKPVFIGIMNGVMSAVDVMKEMWEWSVTTFTTIRAVAPGILKELKEDFYALAGGITAAGIAYLALNPEIVTNTIAAGANSIANLWAAAAMGLETAAMWLLNAALTANPIGIIVVAIGALTTAIIKGYQHSEKFRATIQGIGAVAKDIGLIFWGLGESIIGALTVNPALIKKGFSDMAAGASDVGKAFHRGYEESISESHKDDASKKPNTIIGRQVAKQTTGRAPELTKPAGTTTSKVTGSKVVNIHITIGNLVKEFKVQTTNIKESTGKVHDLIVGALTGAVNDSEIIAGN